MSYRMKEYNFTQLVYLIFLVVTDVIVLVSLLSLNWLEGSKFKRGLWKICIEKRRNIHICFNTYSETWTLACGVLCCFTFIFVLLAIFSTIYHMITFKNKIKRKASMVFILVLISLAICTLFSCLVAFPAVFTLSQMDKYHVRFQILIWNISWAYGLGWAALIFLIGTFTLILLDPATYFSDVRMNRKMSLSSVNTDEIVAGTENNKQNSKILSSC